MNRHFFLENEIWSFSPTFLGSLLHNGLVHSAFFICDVTLPSDICCLSAHCQLFVGYCLPVCKLSDCLLCCLCPIACLPALGIYLFATSFLFVWCLLSVLCLSTAGCMSLFCLPICYSLSVYTMSAVCILFVWYLSPVCLLSILWLFAVYRSLSVYYLPALCAV